MLSLLNCIDQLIHEEGEDRGVLGKLKKYSGDIGAGALAHLTGKAVTSHHDVGSGLLASGGVYGAYKLADIGSNNYQAKNKSLSGSAIGGLTGRGLAHLALHGLQKYNDHIRHIA